MSEELYIVYGLAMLAVAIAWIILPFAIFGIKGRLDTSLRLQRQIVEHLAAMGAPASPAAPKRSDPDEAAEVLGSGAF